MQEGEDQAAHGTSGAEPPDVVGEREPLTDGGAVTPDNLTLY